MKDSSLPRQIVVLVAAVLLAVLSVLWFSLSSMRETMDAAAAEESRGRMAGRMEAFQEQVSLLASDYHNWTDLYLAATQQEFDELGSNYGITAERGDIFQYAELFDGSFAAPVSWRMGRGLAPQRGILLPETRETLRREVAQLNTAERETFDYFEMRDGDLVMFSASYLLPEHDELLDNLDWDALAIAAIGKVLPRQRLSEIESEFAISGLEILAAPPTGQAVSISVDGAAGTPVAWFRWTPPRPGTQLFWKMFPIMSGVSFIFVIISYYGARLLRGKAEMLIEKEAISFETARVDSLTNLPNRLALREHLARLSNRSDLRCAVLAIDLVRFKQVNDTVGHHGGDAFLAEFARRMGSLADAMTFVSRCGGDEFFIAISAAEGLEDVISGKIQQIMALSGESIRINNVKFEVLASKGLATDEERSIDGEELLRRADRAMYAAKARGSQQVVRYDGRMHSEDQEERRIQLELRHALADGGGFEMHYQPIVSAQNLAHIVQYEALARWTCPNLGRVNPEKFIRAAEANGLMLPLGWILLDLVCRDLNTFEGVRTSVNISPSQLMTPGFAREFSDRVAAHGISPSRIGIEVTEQIVIRDDITVTQELSLLRSCGFTLALDDFGTGYSSVGYLTRMPFDALKIDRSFVQEVHTAQGARMVKSMVGLARAMDLKIIAEGLETPEDVGVLRALGADLLQGYHSGKPAPLARFEGRQLQVV